MATKGPFECMGLRMPCNLLLFTASEIYSSSLHDIKYPLIMAYTGGQPDQEAFISTGSRRLAAPPATTPGLSTRALCERIG
jgi:hypothetical protein